MSAEEIIKQKLDELSVEKQAEVIDFIEFLIQKQNQSLSNDSASIDAIEEMVGLGQEIWQGIDPDQYVKALREDWA